MRVQSYSTNLNCLEKCFILFFSDDFFRFYKVFIYLLCPFFYFILFFAYIRKNKRSGTLGGSFKKHFMKIYILIDEKIGVSSTGPEGTRETPLVTRLYSLFNLAIPCTS